ncbi:hypothetical protein CTAYLR_005067 [Chrysophaeum taylorii]|uniref:Condensin-2 complex subunit H2 n=1 Tax=Chrysophaeum taylorii TaxID=2483200 RepID=A0AAD7UAM3_9STRA|nr:hypothetical protein CTAYLR_005067 [Chrysophaeum taylorii]
MDERFGALLRPIRDAALAFEVDVSAELEEYIEQCVRAIDESNLVNFAEAGLLVQGSALILGRKVEHLHSLVYKTLEKLKTQRSRPERSAAEDDEEEALDEARPLVPLGDDDPILKPGKNIDLGSSRRQSPKPPLNRLLYDDEEGAFAGCAWGADGALVLLELMDVREDAPRREEAEEVVVEPAAVFDDDEPPPPPLQPDEPPLEPPMAEDPPPVVKEAKAPLAFEDPYAELDPHDPVGDRRPRKRGKYWKLPPPRRPASEPSSLGARAAIACAAVARATTEDERRDLLSVAVRAAEAHREVNGHQPDDHPEPMDEAPDHCDDDLPPPPDDDDVVMPPVDDDDEDDEEEEEEECRDRRVSTASSTLSKGEYADLTRRVAAWQAQVELKLSEYRAPFDARRSATDLTDDLKKIKDHKHVPFAAITNKLPRYEVCRRFLAALQLANDAKVALHHTSNADEMPDKHDFRLTLLVDDSRLDQIAEVEEENDAALS